MKRQLCIRTVLDARSPSTKYLYQLLLLVASWHRRVRETAPLEVFIIGRPPAALLEWFRSLGVRWQLVDADPNDDISKTSNTIRGAADAERERILLVDNDVVFLGDLSELAAVDDGFCLGAVAGSQRVSNDRWEVIERHFGIAALPTAEVPLREQMRVAAGTKESPAPLRNVYVNGGVLLLPAGVGFEQTWRKYVREIAEVFEHHPLNSRCVRGSNMAGLAMAIAEHNQFDWLDVKFNYRPDCFCLGLRSFEQLQIVHLTGVDDSHRTVAGRVEDFWRNKMLVRFSRVRSALEPAEEQRRLADIRRLYEELHILIHDYHLEDLAARLPRSTAHLWKSSWDRIVNRPLFRLYGHALRTAARVRRSLVSS